MMTRIAATHTIAKVLTWMLLLALVGCSSASPQSDSPPAASTPSAQPAETSSPTGEVQTDPAPTEIAVTQIDGPATPQVTGATETLSPVPASTDGLVVCDERAFDGYTLFNPRRGKTVYLIDIHGQVVHTWQSPYPSPNAAYLLENGNLLLPVIKERNQVFGQSGGSGCVLELNWDSDVLWEFEYSSDQVRLHHDIEPLPSGNVLMIAWELKTVDKAIAAGRDPNLIAEGGLWPDHLIEVDPATSEIVWEWHVWDHLIQDQFPDKDNYGVVTDHPELLDINHHQGQVLTDMSHINAVDYHPELDQILLTVHKTNEIWIIDHGTTIEEAAGHTGGRRGVGGDILYRWGNPEAYHSGGPEDRQLYLQHDARWIVEGPEGTGHILIFNNGHGRMRPFSTVVEIVPPMNADGSYASLAGGVFGPSEPVWNYAAEDPEDLYATNLSGAQRLPNGNTLISDGPGGTLFEVTGDGEIVWSYVIPFAGHGPRGEIYELFKAHRYAPDYPGLAGRGLD